MARSTQVLVTGAKSPLKFIHDVIKYSDKRPIIVGVTDVGGTNFLVTALITHLIGIKAEFVAGYPGTRQTSMAAIRGEVDLVSAAFSSLRGRLESGDMRALLLVAKARRPMHPAAAAVSSKDVTEAVQKAARFAPLLKSAIERVRK